MCRVRPRLRCLLIVLFAVIFCTHWVAAQDRSVPPALEPWIGWVMWDQTDLDCPAIYDQYEKKVCTWPGQLNLDLNSTGGSWRIVVTAYAESWFKFPGNIDVWPNRITMGGGTVVVVERNGRPAVKLSAGRHEISGSFSWNQLPQQLAIPPNVGIVSLQIDGAEIASPSWDAEGNLWLRRTQTEDASSDQLSVQVYRLILDGIPITLRTRLEVTVSGRSREEDFGVVLPEGWKLAKLDSPLPVAVDRRDRMRSQVRAGKWTIEIDAFLNANTPQIKFADDAERIIDQELVALQPDPKLRLLELGNVRPIDVSQTTFPKEWAHLQTFIWDTSGAIDLLEKMRGMGTQRSEKLTVDRTLWFGQDGRKVIFRDTAKSEGHRWRLDTAASQQLGAVRIGGEGQIVTRNPVSGASGVEIRMRSVELDAVGQIEDPSRIPATGWQANVDRLSATLELPPGWRAVAVFGPDRVYGDWLTSWTMLDLFLLLVFGLAVTRIWGIPAGLIAFIGFGLSYHELHSPRYTWFLLMIPAAIIRYLPTGRAQRVFRGLKYAALVPLLIVLISFIAIQVQSGLYPQLEPQGVHYRARDYPMPDLNIGNRVRSEHWVGSDYAQSEIYPQTAQQDIQSDIGSSKFFSRNLLADPSQQVQTGPASPEWTWNQVICDWDGPVSADQVIRPILSPPWVNRLLVPLRIVLLLAILGILMNFKLLSFPRGRAATAVLVILLANWTGSGVARAQEFPDENLLKELRSRLLEAPDAFPRAAEIPSVELRIDGNRVSMKAEVHTAARTAVPLPGQLTQWYPLKVMVNGQANELVCRRDGYLWIVLNEGVHEVTVETLLTDASSWEWRYLLRPRYVAIDAPGWAIKGLQHGKPESQILFTRDMPQSDEGFSYDRTDLNAIIAVDRRIEIGLVWQVHTTIRRLTADGKSISVNIPLLAGERMLTSNVTVVDGWVDVRLGPNEQELTWISALPSGTDLTLSAQQTDEWRERWELMASPSWNVNYSGLAPIFDDRQEGLLPSWYPWPGEQVGLQFSQPTAIVGVTATIQNGIHEVTVGSRQRSSDLTLTVDCSVGGDFRLTLDPRAEITELRVANLSIPVRRDNADVIVPLSPGKQTVNLKWQTDNLISARMPGEPVTLQLEAANITTVVRMPRSRWTLWTDGPLVGPAVRVWTILAVALIIAIILGSLSLSTLKRWEWMLLFIGLTQIALPFAFLVVGWLLVLQLIRKRQTDSIMPEFYNVQQVGIIILTIAALVVVIAAVSEGLLGNPKMFVSGNGSSATVLRWYEPFTDGQLPTPTIWSISIWFYQLAMLLWALWLASSILKWLRDGWKYFIRDGFFKPISSLGRRAIPPVVTQESEIIDAHIENAQNE